MHTSRYPCGGRESREGKGIHAWPSTRSQARVTAGRVRKHLLQQYLQPPPVRSPPEMAGQLRSRHPGEASPEGLTGVQVRHALPFLSSHLGDLQNQLRTQSQLQGQAHGLAARGRPRRCESALQNPPGAVGGTLGCGFCCAFAPPWPAVHCKSMHCFRSWFCVRS